jgi:tetratricopeptide (TPR) repeat protein
MLSQLIQRQVPIGSKVAFSLGSGHKISGILVELGRDHVTLEHDGGTTVIPIEKIEFWEISEKQSAQGEGPAQALVNESLSDSPSDGSPIPPPPSAPSSSSPLEPEVTKKLLEVEARFQAQLDAATLEEVKAPDFTFPANELKGDQGAKAQTVWNRIRDKYSYAAKNNELSAKFGRIQPIVGELKTLAEKFPRSSSVKRHLAYLYWLLKNQKESLSLYKEVAFSSKDAWDWYNVTVLALSEGQEDLACYGLEQFFNQVPVTEALKTWYFYIGLLKKCSNYPLLHNLTRIKGRNCSEEEGGILLETGIYLLKTLGKEQLATQLVQKRVEGQSPALLAFEAFSHLDGQASETYQKLVSELTARVEKKTLRPEIQHQPQGYISTYKPDRNFGFLRGIDGEDYFFHRSAISDDELFNKVRDLVPGKQIPVIFEAAQGPKGPVAIGVTLFRTVGEMYARATEYANDGEYSKAIAQVRKVLDLDPEYPGAQESYEKWREYARMAGVPRGSNPYARAKRVQLVEKDLDKAAQLLRLAINQGDNVESAVKDLAALLAQRGKPQEAINTLLQHRKKIREQQSVDNLLINLYQNAGQYDQAITLLQKKLERAPTEGKKVEILWQIANCYLRKEDYAQAERNFRAVLKSQPDNADNKAAQRNIAFCFFKQERYEEAQRILERILNTSPDAQAADLLEAINQARAGQIPQLDEIVIETTLSDYSREVSKFAQFFLDRCDFQGVPPDRVQGQSFNPVDIQKLEELATQLGRRRPRDRAAYYLSAAKIVTLLEDEDPNQFYRYLCRSFASRGDAVVIENRPLDAARAFYCEALSTYDGYRNPSRYDEQDAENALVRFLFSTLGQGQIPIKPHIPSIDETLEVVLTNHPNRTKVFDAIAYLVFRSRYAANRTLNRLYEKSSHQAIALEYLKSKSVSVPSPVKRLADFVRLWNELQRKSFDDARFISNELRLLANVEFTTASLEGSIERVKRLISRLFFDLDQQRMTQLQEILETALQLCKQSTFEEQERLSIQIGNRCQDLLREIEASPTKLSIEEVYPVIETIRRKANNRLEELYESSTPQITLRLPVESYTPDNNQRIEVQIVVSNRMGCSPAEALELIVQEYEDAFMLSVPEIKLESSLRGGDQRILRAPLRIGKEALESQTFSLPVYAQYRTRSGETTQTPVNNFSVRLYAEEEFEEIENPYAAYAEGGVVGDPEMFYGREELIANVARTIRESRTQSKCVVIFGQKRAGKSSILHHLKIKLQSNTDLVILDLGNIGAILDEHSSSPFLYQILREILRKLEYAIEDRGGEGQSPLSLSFPSDKEFYEHHSPLMLFKSVFEQFRRAATKLQNWRGVRLVLLIDEFSYIYGYIRARRIPESFMKNWKALLQENYFSAVLVGQDVMPKFKQHFPNEFGTTQDERVTYLKREDALKLIDEPIRIGGRQGESRYRERARERIIDLTAGSPFYIQILCNRLVEYMNRKRARLVTEADVEQVKEELIRGNNALGLDKFDNLLNSGDTSEDAISDEDALKVLTMIAMNSQTGPCSRHNITCETHTPLDEILDDLVKRDVIERERSHYYSIRVDLFKEWLIAHH